MVESGSWDNGKNGKNSNFAEYRRLILHWLETLGDEIKELNAKVAAGDTALRGQVAEDIQGIKEGLGHISDKLDAMGGRIGEVELDVAKLKVRLTRWSAAVAGVPGLAALGAWLVTHFR